MEYQEKVKKENLSKIKFNLFIYSLIFIIALAIFLSLILTQNLSYQDYNSSFNYVVENQINYYVYWFFLIFLIIFLFFILNAAYFGLLYKLKKINKFERQILEWQLSFSLLFYIGKKIETKQKKLIEEEDKQEVKFKIKKDYINIFKFILILSFFIAWVVILSIGFSRLWIDIYNNYLNNTKTVVNSFDYYISSGILYLSYNLVNLTLYSLLLIFSFSFNLFFVSLSFYSFTSLSEYQFKFLLFSYINWYKESLKKIK